MNIKNSLTFVFILLIDLTFVYSQGNETKISYLGKIVAVANRDTAVYYEFGNVIKNEYFIVKSIIKNYNNIINGHNDSIYFHGCNSKNDSIIWFYFYIKKNLLNTQVIQCSKPVRFKKKKGVLKIYNCVILILNGLWTVDVETFNDKIYRIYIFKKGVVNQSEFGYIQKE